MKVLHLSDLHFTADDQVNRPLIDRITFSAQNYPAHFFVITGDIVDNEGDVALGTSLPVPNMSAIIPTALLSPPPPLGPIDPHLARTRLAMQKARDELARLPQGRVIVCAGNHDFGLWGNIYATEFVSAFDELIFKPILDRGGPTDGSTVFASSLDTNFPVLSAQKPILYVITSDGVTLTLVSVCTPADPILSLPTALATGLVGREQLDMLSASVLNPIAGASGIGTLFGPKVVMMHHHPFIHNFTMQLEDADSFMSIARNNADLIMFGHQHVEKRYEPNEVPGGGFRCGALAAGSSRTETGAWEVEISPPVGTQPALMTFQRVPIVD